MSVALELIDGSSGNVDLTINSVSYKALLNYWTADINREFYEATTFASGAWKEERPGMKQLTFSATGYLGKQDVMADPSLTLGSTAPTTIVLTADTGCTFTFDGYESRVRAGVRAAAMSEFGIDGRSSGAVTVAWIVAVGS